MNPLMQFSSIQQQSLGANARAAAETCLLIDLVAHQGCADTPADTSGTPADLFSFPKPCHSGVVLRPHEAQRRRRAAALPLRALLLQRLRRNPALELRLHMQQGATVLQQHCVSATQSELWHGNHGWTLNNRNKGLHLCDLGEVVPGGQGRVAAALAADLRRRLRGNDQLSGSFRTA